MRETGAYTTVELDDEVDVDNLIENAQEVMEGMDTVPDDIVHTVAVPFDELAIKACLGPELRYIETLLEPSEMRSLLSDLYYEFMEAGHVTHYDLSDIVCTAVGPSRIQEALSEYENSHTYCSAVQYLQAYNSMRYISPLMAVINYHHLVKAIARAFNTISVVPSLNFTIDEYEYVNSGFPDDEPTDSDIYYYDPKLAPSDDPVKNGSSHEANLADVASS